eukprot:Hpha_TRINITY_DN8392_c0_g1::TRINITY_DN8392_c0_g1_i1::g.154365::m.154365
MIQSVFRFLWSEGGNNVAVTEPGSAKDPGRPQPPAVLRLECAGKEVLVPFVEGEDTEALARRAALAAGANGSGAALVSDGVRVSGQLPDPGARLLVEIAQPPPSPDTPSPPPRRGLRVALVTLAMASAIAIHTFR